MPGGGGHIRQKSALDHLQLKVEDAPQVEHERLQALIGWRVLSKRLEHLGWRLHTAPLRERLERPRRQSDERAGSRLYKRNVQNKRFGDTKEEWEIQRRNGQVWHVGDSGCVCERKENPVQNR